ncbi:MAG TPA: CBS domain-containing protein [Candidatus Binataceae bacterium]|nr:CBS domain-containing protein [Candidatus Binataceae bacterium]
MTRDPVTVTPGDSLSAAKAKMEAGDFRRIPVIDGGRLVGILSEYDLKNYLRVLDSTTVHTAMTGSPVTISSSESPEAAAALLRKHNIGALPVVDHGRLVGIVSAKNLWMSEPRPLPEWDPRTRR